MQELMCFESCTSIRPACSQCVSEPVTSVALPAVVEKVTAAVPRDVRGSIFQNPIQPNPPDY